MRSAAQDMYSVDITDDPTSQVKKYIQAEKAKKKAEARCKMYAKRLKRVRKEMERHRPFSHAI
jgi:hypothetical protein